MVRDYDCLLQLWHVPGWETLAYIPYEKRVLFHEIMFLEVMLKCIDIIRVNNMLIDFVFER